MRTFPFLGALSGVTLAVIGCAATENAETTDDALTQTPAPSACTAASMCASIAVRKANATCSLVVVFDGSGVYSPDIHSNVGRIFTEAKGPAATSGPQGLNGEIVDPTTTRVYIEGVPTLPFGSSAERVDRGRGAICQHLQARAEDHCAIVLLGYSRGAFIANELAHAMNDFGCADGSHKGQPIAFLGGFDPVNAQMGTEWEAQSWYGHVPSNVANVLQVFKDPLEDPRFWEGIGLTTTLMSTSGIPSSCYAPMTAANHPEHKPWHHGEVGHGALPMDTMKCALERAGIALF